jgi:hypothetical protein
MTHINTYLLPAHHSPKLPARPTRRWHDHKTLEPPSNPARFNDRLEEAAALAGGAPRTTP